MRKRDDEWKISKKGKLIEIDWLKITLAEHDEMNIKPSLKKSLEEIITWRLHFTHRKLNNTQRPARKKASSSHLGSNLIRDK